MKSAIAILTITAALFTGCSSPEHRHDTRVERRHDVAENTTNRVDNRQGNRYDRRDDRRDRVDTRY